MLSRDDAKVRLQRILGTDQSAEAREDQNATRVPLSWEEFPVPGLIFIALKTILGLASYGPWEKMAWGFNTQLGKSPFSIRFEKFGLRLYVPSDAGSDLAADVKRALLQCCSVAEEFLMTDVAAQLQAGNVTINNEYYRFEDAYRFFRDSAVRAYAGPPPQPVTIQTPSGAISTSQPFRPQQEGGYLASAMLDAYFSKLEHLLVLLAAFSPLKVEQGGLQKLVGDRWDDKFKALFDVSADAEAKRVYDTLKRLKEQLRNPASHGGFLKKGASFLFHSEAGALPVLLTRSKQGLDLVITPIPPATFETVCKALDEADEFFKKCALSAGMLYAEAGLDVAFDAESRRRYHEAMSSGSIEQLIRQQAYLHDMHANMDF